MSEESYLLEKFTWSSDNFGEMGWHDCRTHAVALDHDSAELLLDIDYILKWVPPAEGETYYKFWIAPATLVFREVSNITLQLETDCRLEIDAISRHERQWNIEFQEGSVHFQSSGFMQYIRQNPRLIDDAQYLSLDRRGGICFSKVAAR